MLIISQIFFLEKNSCVELEEILQNIEPNIPLHVKDGKIIAQRGEGSHSKFETKQG